MTSTNWLPIRKSANERAGVKKMHFAEKKKLISRYKQSSFLVGSFVGRGKQELKAWRNFSDRESLRGLLMDRRQIWIVLYKSERSKRGLITAQSLRYRRKTHSAEKLQIRDQNASSICKYEIAQRLRTWGVKQIFWSLAVPVVCSAAALANAYIRLDGSSLNGSCFINLVNQTPARLLINK